MAPIAFSLTQETVGNTVGVVFLGVVAASCLFGINTLQTYYYYHAYPKDSLFHRCAVGTLWLLDALHLALAIRTVHFYAVAGFANPFALINIPLSLKIQIACNAVITTLVHSLYALRVWRLGNFHKGLLGYFVAFIVAAGFAVGVVLAYSMFSIDTVFQLGNISWAITAGLSTSTAIDFIISSAMCYYLRKSRVAVTRLNSRISTLIQYTLGTGLLTSACSLLTLFSFHLLPNTLVFLALEFLLTKLYTGSFVTMLNARERKGSKETFDDSLSVIGGGWPAKIKVDTTIASFWSPPPATQSLSEGSVHEASTTEPTRSSFQTLAPEPVATRNHHW